MEIYTNCMDCPNHIVEADPDPYDWFCDDDQAVLCKLSKNLDKKRRSWDGRIWELNPITLSCRPHHKRKECDTPDWCPLIKNLTIEELVAHVNHCSGSSGSDSEGFPIECPICAEFYSRGHKLQEKPVQCVCEGNWRDIIHETEGKIGNTFVDFNGKEWVLDGILWAEDDFYYFFVNDNGDIKYCSCVATLEIHGMKEIE